jgi:hypothetical protein
MKPLALLLTVGTLLMLTGCSDSKPPAEEKLELPKYKFDAEDFGIGRKHTPNAGCNRQIDALLEEIRACYNTQPAEACQAIQEKHNDRIGRLKNLTRCRR